MEQLLIIEDDTGLNQGLSKALKADDRQIISCHDLKTARKQLLCGSVSLILLDINLPDGNGLDLLKEIKEKTPDVPVILLTTNDTDMEILQAKNLKKIYGSGNNAVHALDGVDLSVKKGEFVAIVGTSGSGKSTLLHMLGGLDRPTSGTVMVDGQDIFSLKEEALTIFRRRKIGFVFQAYNLVPVLNVYENIVLPIELDGGKVNKDFVQQIVQTLGLDDRLDALPNQLSGGQQQRVAIARALAAAPAIILADEPTGNLDSKTSQDVLSLLKVTSQKFAQTIVMITHNEEIAQMADRIIRIEDGRIVSQN